jgi:membrane-bound inhibitor of C-type lysozyme/uncharacterized lipoprotein YbaY
MKMEILKEIQDNWKFVLLSIIIAIFLISLSNAQASAADLNVSLSYREMIALAPDAEARLMLINPAAAETEFILIDLKKKLKNGVPIDFKLKLSEQEIDLNSSYQLLGIIKSGRDMVWTESKTFKGTELLQQKDIKLLTKRLPARFISFSGEKDLKVKFLDSLAQVIIDNEEYLLPQQRTASGAKFANSKLSIWNKGRELLIEKDNRSYQAALVSLADINSETEVIKARGQEPYWEFKIDKNSLELQYDYLTNKIIISKANIEKIEKSNSLIYKIDTSFLDFEIKILEDLHTDQMNGRLYPLTAFVKINGQKYIGGADLQ